jgi:hypothetical protein
MFMAIVLVVTIMISTIRVGSLRLTRRDSEIDDIHVLSLAGSASLTVEVNVQPRSTFLESCMGGNFRMACRDRVGHVF